MSQSMQSLLQPLLMAECLESRLHDHVAALEAVLSDIPAAYADSRSHLVDAIAQVNAAIDTLKMIAHMRTINVRVALGNYIQQNQDVPHVEDPLRGHSDES